MSYLENLLKLTSKTLKDLDRSHVPKDVSLESRSGYTKGQNLGDPYHSKERKVLTKLKAQILNAPTTVNADYSLYEWYQKAAQEADRVAGELWDRSSQVWNENDQTEYNAVMEAHNQVRANADQYWRLANAAKSSAESFSSSLSVSQDRISKKTVASIDKTLKRFFQSPREQADVISEDPSSVSDTLNAARERASRLSYEYSTKPAVQPTETRPL